MLRGVTIGCGFFSRIQMEAWVRVSGARIDAACDLLSEKSAEFAADFGIEPYRDVDHMLDEQKPDFVDIATRPSTHAALVAKCAARKIPVLCQKPMAETWKEASALVEVARKAGIRLMINENWRWQAWYRHINGLISGGKIGKPFYYSIQTRNRDGLGDQPYPNQPYFAQMPRLLLIETLVHHLDTARFLMGDISQVYCRTAKLNAKIRAEDMALILVTHESGVSGVIDGNRASHPDGPGPAMEIARFEGLDQTLRLNHAGDVFLGADRVFEGADLPGYRGDSCRATQQHFIDCLLQESEFESEAGDYLAKTFAVVEACYLSAAEDRPVKISEMLPS